MNIIKIEDYVKKPESYRYFWPIGLELNGNILYFEVNYKNVKKGG